MVGGSGVLTVQDLVAGVGSTLPAASVAWTENWWEPTASAEYAFGEVHAPQAPLSSSQLKVESDSLETIEKLAEVRVVVPLGPPEIEVCGGVVSVAEGEGAASEVGVAGGAVALVGGAAGET